LSGRETIKPLLASEALMEDLAPVEPARRAARLWCGAVGVVLIGSGVLPFVGLRPGGLAAALPCFLVGAVALLTALANVSYQRRATTMILLGIIAAPVGLYGTAVADAVGGIPGGALRMVAATALAGTLLFRARYRAYPRARIFLGGAVVAALPVVAISIYALATRGIGPGQLGPLFALAAVAAALPGFMGAETTGAGTAVGPIVIIALAAEQALRALAATRWSVTAASLTSLSAASVAFLASSLLGALGLFQLLAWRFAADARRIDLHPPLPPDPPSSQRDMRDWGSRE
jgi:hypothetical protein